MKDKTYKLLILVIVLLPLLIIGILFLFQNKITGKAVSQDTCITDSNEFQTDPPSECLSGEEKFYFKENGCIIGLGCYTPPSC